MVGFRIKPLWKSIFLGYDKYHLTFSVKFVEKVAIQFLSFYFLDLNRLCKQKPDAAKILLPKLVALVYFETISGINLREGCWRTTALIVYDFLLWYASLVSQLLRVTSVILRLDVTEVFIYKNWKKETQNFKKWPIPQDTFVKLEILCWYFGDNSINHFLVKGLQHFQINILPSATFSSLPSSCSENMCQLRRYFQICLKHLFSLWMEI